MMIFNMQEASTNFTTISNKNIKDLKADFRKEQKQETSIRKSMGSTMLSLNPHVESFLSFNADNEKSTLILNKSKNRAGQNENEVKDGNETLFNISDMNVAIPLNNQDVLINDFNNQFGLDGNGWENQNEEFLGNVFENQNGFDNFFSPIKGQDGIIDGISVQPPQFNDIIPQNLHSKEFSSELQDYEQKTFKRSEETFNRLENYLNQRNDQSFNKSVNMNQVLIPTWSKENGQTDKECAVSTFIDLLFLNQGGRVRLEQQQPHHFSDIHVSLCQ